MSHALVRLGLVPGLSCAPVGFGSLYPGRGLAKLAYDLEKLILI